MASGARLHAFFTPRSVALVGVPGDVSAPLARPLVALRAHGFPGAIYPVNARHERIGDLRCYRSIAELPERPDMAWISVPGDRVVAVLDDCAAAGIRHAVIVSAGFAEAGDAGRARQREMTEHARRAGIALLGPNSIGFANVCDRVTLSFSIAVAVPSLIEGEVAIVSQSGGLGGCVLNRLQDRRIGASYFMSTGNEADIGLAECVDFLVDDPRTRVIVLVVEGVRDGAEFRRVAARALEADKPIIAVRLGLTDLGGHVARSHTGAIVGSRRAWEAVVSQLGIIEVADVGDITDAVIWTGRARAGKGSRVAVVTSSGGAAVHLADRLSDAGFTLPQLGAATVERLRAVLPGYATASNPLDITAGLREQTFEMAAREVVADGEFDALVMPLTMLSEEQSRARVGAARAVAASTGSAVALCWLGGSLAGAGVSAADEQGVAAFTSASGMLRAMAGARDREAARRRWVSREAVAESAPLPAPGRGMLSYADSLELMARFGIPGPAQALVPDASSAVQAAAGMGYPVVLKLVGADFAHKSDRHALRLGLRDADEVGRAARELEALMAGSACEGILVQRMAEGFEVAVGVVRDETFGPLLMIGPGGTGVELSGEHRCLPLPVTADDVRATLDTIPSFRRLRGFRHEPARDRDALVDTILRVSRLAMALRSSLRELDLNPLMVGAEGKGVAAVDVLAVLED